MRKNLFLTLLFLMPLYTLAQLPRIYFESNQTTTNIRGTSIKKNDTVDVKVMYDPNGNTNVRSIYFDFQHQGSAFDLIDVIMPAAEGNNSALPLGANITRDWYEYPGYAWVSTSQNNTTNGNTNYRNSQYQLINGAQITRVYTNIASSNPLKAGVYMTLRFRMLDTQAGYSYNPLVMNFAATYSTFGEVGSEMINPRSNQFIIDAASNSLITATLELNSNLMGENKPKMMVIETDQTGTTMSKSYLFDISDDGKVNIDQSLLKPNQWYKMMAAIPMDNLITIQDKAITVSDYTSVQNEFVKQNLDGTFQNINLKTGMSYLAADVNYSRTLDGADLTRLFAHVVTVDNLVQVPPTYQIGSNGYMSVPTLLASQFNDSTPSSWRTITNPSVLIQTTSTNQNINLKYLIWGDVNRSHSSQVVQNGQIQSRLMATSVPSIDLNLSNLTVTSNNIEIPFNIVTNDNKTSALQFEVVYDSTKIKFDEIKSEVPNSWYVFVNPTNGKINFGAIDRELKSPINGNLIPFKLKFSSLQNGLDIATQIRITKNIDASDSIGNQLNINLNTTTIKLTGYNKFK